MKISRITIGGMLAFVLVCGLGLGALRSPSLLSTQLVFTLALTVLLGTLVAGLVGKSRSFWIGAAVFGWGYAILAFGPWFSEQVEPWLFSTRIIQEVFVRSRDPWKVPPWPAFPQIKIIGNPAALWVNEEDYIQFMRTGHSLSTIAHCLFGGCVGFLVGGQRERPESHVTKAEMS